MLGCRPKNITMYKPVIGNDTISDDYNDIHVHIIKVREAIAVINLLQKSSVAAWS